MPLVLTLPLNRIPNAIESLRYTPIRQIKASNSTTTMRKHIQLLAKTGFAVALFAFYQTTAFAQDQAGKRDLYGYNNGSMNIAIYDSLQDTPHQAYKDSVKRQMRVLKEYASGLLEVSSDSVDMADFLADCSQYKGRQFTVYGTFNHKCKIHLETFSMDYLVDEACYENQYLVLKELERYIVLGDGAEEMMPSQTIIYAYRPRNKPASKFASMLAGMPVSATITPLEEYNQLLVSGTPAAVKEAVNLLRILDKKVERVFLEFLVVEYNHGRNFEWDFDISNATLGNFSDASLNPKEGAISATYQFLNKLKPNFKMNLKALVANDFANIVTNPHIMAVTHVESEFTAEDKRYLPVQISGQYGTTSDFKEVAARMFLKATPEILSDQMINLRLEIDKSEFVDADAVSGGVATATNHLKTDVILKNGETLIIGGMIKGTDLVSKGGFPILRNIPILGVLFSQKVTRRSYKETVMYVTTYIDPLTNKTIETGVAGSERLVDPKDRFGFNEGKLIRKQKRMQKKSMRSAR